MKPRLLVQWLLLAAVLLSSTAFAVDATPEDIEKLPQYTVEERKLSPWLLWSYARAGQCEILTDRGEESATQAVIEAQTFLEFLHIAHPEAALPRDRKLLFMLSSGRMPLFPTALKLAGRVEQGNTVGIYLAAEEYDLRQMRLFRRELVKAGFGEKSDIPWWYRTGLKNVLAQVRIDGGSVIIGDMPFSNLNDRFMLSGFYLRPYEQVLEFGESHAEFIQQEARWQMERQATALVHVSMFYRHGRFGPALLRFVRDSRVKTRPTQAFEDAYGIRVTDVGPMIRGVVDLEATPTYYFDYAKVIVPVATLDEARSVRRADVDRFRTLFGSE